jgi:outer membrane immunogenic protein
LGEARELRQPDTRCAADAVQKNHGQPPRNFAGPVSTESAFFICGLFYCGDCCLPAVSIQGYRVNIGGGASPKSWTDTTGVFPTLATGTTNPNPPPAIFPPEPPGTPLGTHTARGVAGGWQLGCDYQVGGFVFGLEGRYDLAGMKANNLQPNGFLVDNSFVQTVGMFTGRIGYTVTPTVLVYGKAGGALVHDLYNVSLPPESMNFLAGTMGPPCPIATGSCIGLAPGSIIALAANTKVGVTAGAGLEWALYASNWTLFLEYDYMNFGTSQVPFASTVVPRLFFPLDIKQSVNMVLVGMNWRFWGGNRHY